MADSIKTAPKQVIGEYIPNTSCRICGSDDLMDVLALGDMPLANSLLSEADLSEPEKVYPLNLMLCKSCSLTQLSVSIPPQVMFDEYLYFSSYSDTMLEHARKNVTRLIAERNLGADSLAIEIASNDGYLLQYFVQAGVPVLGIEPAKNIAVVARERGINTITEYFGTPLAQKLVADGVHGDVILANNVLAHVPELHSFVEGIRLVMKPNGVAVIETPYVRTLTDDCKFDTIYHEHLYCYSLTALKNLFAQHSMSIVDVEHIKIHGGSLRIYAMHDGAGVEPSEAVTHLLREEEGWVTDEAYYLAFARNVERIKQVANDTLRGLKAQGKRIAAYGAAAKGTIFLNAFGIGTDVIDFVADKNPHKQDRYMPGVRIPISDPQRIVDEMPDYLLILIWNFAGEIMTQQAEYQKRGGQFITAVPHLKISAIDDLRGL